MPPLLFPLPLTSPLTFSSLLHDPSNSHSGELAEATTTRTKLHLALTGFANGASGSSALAVVDVSSVSLSWVLTSIRLCKDISLT